MTTSQRIVLEMLVLRHWVLHWKQTLLCWFCTWVVCQFFPVSLLFIILKALIRLAENNIKSKGVFALFEMLKVNKALREFNLSSLSSSFFSFLLFSFRQSICHAHTESNVGRSETAALVSALEANTSLRELELQGQDSYLSFCYSLCDWFEWCCLKKHR